MSIRCAVLAAALSMAACSNGAHPKLSVYDIELREKTNSCRPLDPQVAFETMFIQHHGEQAVLHLGAERSFVVDVSPKGYRGHFSESDHARVDGRHVVCKRLTDIDLSIKGDTINGSYTRRRRQDCMVEAKPCQTSWSLSGTLRTPAP